jgi:hypothetical protein
MEYDRYVRRALLMPIVVPLAAAALLLIDRVEHTPVGEFSILVTWSLLVGGIPYLVFLIGFHRWMRGKTEPRIRRALRLAPLCYVPVLALFALPLAVASNHGSLDSETLLVVALFGGMGLAFGYGYVLLAELGWMLLGRRGAPPAAPMPALAAE